jgi:hypothetical protein
MAAQKATETLGYDLIEAEKGRVVVTVPDQGWLPRQGLGALFTARYSRRAIAYRPCHDLARVQRGQREPHAKQYQGAV